MGGRTIRRATTPVLACALGVALAVPGAAPAANVKYFGPADAPGSSVEVRLRIGKGKPKQIFPFEVIKPYMYCSDGTEGVLTSVGGSGSIAYPSDISINKKRKFYEIDIDDGSDDEDGDDIYPPSGDIYEVAGKVAKGNGSITGTYRITASFPNAGATCDSGTVSWTATPGGG